MDGRRCKGECRLHTITTPPRCAELKPLSNGDWTVTTSLQSLIACGTKLWLDSVDPDEVARNRAWGATGATSNPIIVSDLIKTGRFDDEIAQFLKQGLSDESIAWDLTDQLV